MFFTLYDIKDTCFSRGGFLLEFIGQAFGAVEARDIKYAELI